jgi:hypothetical protein
MIDIRYIVGDGLYIKFGEQKGALLAGLNVLQFLKRNASNQQGLDELIKVVHEAIAEKTPVRRICEKCWTPIDHRVDSFHKRNGQIFHDRCMNPSI